MIFQSSQNELKLFEYGYVTI